MADICCRRERFIPWLVGDDGKMLLAPGRESPDDVGCFHDHAPIAQRIVLRGNKDRGFGRLADKTRLGGSPRNEL